MRIPASSSDDWSNFMDINGDRYSSETDAHLGHLAELEALFASLQHRAFTGEL